MYKMTAYKQHICIDGYKIYKQAMYINKHLEIYITCVIKTLTDNLCGYENT